MTPPANRSGELETMLGTGAARPTAEREFVDTCADAVFDSPGGDDGGCGANLSPILDATEHIWLNNLRS